MFPQTAAKKAGTNVSPNRVHSPANYVLAARGLAGSLSGLDFTEQDLALGRPGHPATLGRR